MTTYLYCARDDIVRMTKTRLFMMLLLLVIMIQFNTATVYIEEDFEDGADDTFPARFTDAYGNANWEVESTSPLNGTYSLEFKVDSAGGWALLLHDSSIPNDYCYFVEFNSINSNNGKTGIMNRANSNYDGYLFETRLSSSTTTWTRYIMTAATPAGQGDFNGITVSNSVDYTIRGCVEGTTINQNITQSGTTSSDSWTDVGDTYPNGSIGFYGYEDTNREWKADNLCVYSVDASFDDCFQPGAPGQAPNITLSTDFINGTEIFTDTFTFNFTGVVVNNTDLYACSAYEDGVLSGIWEGINITNTYPYQTNVSNTDGTYRSFNITCTSTNASDSFIRWAYIDTVNPTISTTLGNNSQHLINTTISWTTTYADNSLHIYNGTVFDITGAVYKSLTAYAENLTTSPVLNLTSFFANETGNFTFKAVVKDGHTLNIIPNITWEKYTVEINGDTYKGISFANNFLNLTTDMANCIDNFTLQKEHDRYKFIFEFKASCVGQEFQMYQQSKHPMYYAGDRWGYDGHFIIKDYWLDWMSEDVTGLNINHLPNFNAYRIRFTPTSQLVIFDSIGIINTVTKIYNFEIIDADFLVNTTYIIPDTLNTFSTGVGYCQAISDKASVNIKYDYNLYVNGDVVLQNDFGNGSGLGDGYSQWGTQNLPTDPLNATDNDGTTFALFGTSPLTSVYNISKTLSTIDTTFMSVDVYLENFGSGPSATGFTFYCLTSPTTLGYVDGITLSVGDDFITSPLVVNVTNADCLNWDNRYVYLSISNEASPINGGHLIELNNTVWSYNYTTYNSSETVQLFSYGNFTSNDTVVLECRGYDGTTFTSFTNSTTYTVSTLTIDNVTYTGNISGFVRNLTYSINYKCFDSSTTTINRFIDGSYDEKITGLTCNNASQNTNDIYTHSAEGSYDISFYFNTTVDPSISNDWFGNATFISDLINPTVIINLTSVGGFSINQLNITLQCIDNIDTTLGYNTTLNAVLLLDETNANNTIVTNSTVAVAGLNTMVSYCADDFGASSTEINATAYVRELILIDERTGLDFDVTNITSAILYWDDNSTSYSFTDEGTTGVNFTSFNDDKLRLELIYPGQTVITRYIDVTLIEDSTRICANIEGITHYAQIVTSAQLKQVVVRSLFADCYVVADYTRFAYQNGKSIQFYTIDTQYALNTYDANGVLYQLSSIDGSLNEPINLDTLELNAAGYNFGINQESLGVQKTDTTELTIRYLNLANNNDAASVEVIRLDTNTVIYTDASIVSPNDFTFTIDYGSLTNVNGTTLFKATVTKDRDGDITTMSRYFNINGKTGILSAQVAAFLAIMLIIFGMSFTVAQTSFSWFGILIQITAVGLLSFAISTWYIVFLQAICFILAAYTVIILVQKNQVTIA